MLKAGSLAYAIAVSVIVAIICTMMILLAYMNRSYFIHTDWHDRLKDNAHSAISIGLTSDSNEDFQEWKDLFEDGSDSVWIKKRRWGAYEVIFASAKHRNLEFSKTAIKAYTSEETKALALWLTDRNRPLQISGNALLKGNCSLPKKGLDRAYIEGKNYTRKELMYGEKSLSTSKLPEIDKELLDYWSKYLRKEYNQQDSLVDAGKMEKQLSHSFQKKTIIYHSSEEIDLRDIDLSGNILISSEKNIKVGEEVTLNQVILVAPIITLEKTRASSLHIIASDTVILGEDVEMEYPSSIIMKSTDQVPYLKISEGVNFRGCIVSALGDLMRRTNNLSMEINEKAFLKGQVYCEGNFEHMGTIEGTVIANNFLLKTPSGIYENHLLNGKIDRTELSKNFGGLAFGGWKNKSKTIEWLEL